MVGKESHFGEVWLYAREAVHLWVMAIAFADDDDQPPSTLTTGIVLRNDHWPGHPVGSEIKVYLNTLWRKEE